MSYVSFVNNISIIEKEFMDYHRDTTQIQNTKPGLEFFSALFETRLH